MAARLSRHLACRRHSIRPLQRRAAAGPSNVHQFAQEGFSRMSEYEKGRPTYPSSATKLLDRIFTKNLGASTVVDLGAGTGKWTSTLVNYFQGPNTTAAKFQVHAVEPVVNFREVLRSKFSSCNEVVVHDGSAKDLTRLFRPGSINAISVATAFHWFATEEDMEDPGSPVSQSGNIPSSKSQRSILAGTSERGDERKDVHGNTIKKGDKKNYRCSFRDEVEEEPVHDIKEVQSYKQPGIGALDSGGKGCCSIM